MSDAPIITPRDDGPLIAKNITSMTGSNGEIIETKNPMPLCRCGASSNKPFCDGTHREIDFKTEQSEPSGKDKIFTYTDGDVTVHYSKLLCSHAGECVRRSKEMFDPDRKPWIKPDQNEVELLGEIIAACPSGALRMSHINGEPVHMYAEAPQLHVEKNGAIWVSDVELEGGKDIEGKSEKKMALCRCGLSSNKPYCDGSHYEENWKSND